MATQALNTITREEFDIRIDANNARLKQELVESQERVQQLEALIVRKELFAQRLDQILLEVECAETEITALAHSIQK